MTQIFPEIKKNFGFGCMRFPKLADGSVDVAQVEKMVDRFLEAGFNYFDTARMYVDGKSEEILKKTLTSRYSRDRFVLTDKLSSPYFEKEEDILPLFEDQLRATGVSYFDFYLMHAQGSGNYPKYQRTHAYEIAAELKKQGKIRHLGISFHDKPEFLDKILTEHPEVEVVQIQFNYADFEDPGVRSRECYEVCRKHGKPVLVMEPVKGGALVNLPKEALDLYAPTGMSPASFALRFAAGFEGIFMTLSGMSDIPQMEDNISFMGDFKPLTDDERALVARATEIYRAGERVGCTACRYCVPGCPAKIEIPALIAALNARLANAPDADELYAAAIASGVKPTACIRCGKCEQICPQHLNIRRALWRTGQIFE